MATTKLRNLRTQVSDFARSYKYLFDITPKVSSGSLSKILTQDVKNKIMFSCVTTNMPSKGVQQIDVEVGVYTMHEPGRKELGATITPEFIMNGDYSIYQFFEAWNRLATGDNGKSALPGEFHAAVVIKMMDSQDQVRMVKKYENAWCRLCPEIQYSDDANEIIRFQPEILYEFDTNEFPTPADAGYQT